jgi:hypothetical protein
MNAARKVKKSLLLLAAAALSVAAFATPTLADAAKPAAGVYQAPLNGYAQPDLEGTWTNATLTAFERPAEFGDRLVLNDQEVRKIEGAESKAIADGNAPTDPSVKTTDLPHDCGRGFSGAGCGYNYAWIDPGTTVMRVNGEPRSSLLTSTSNGRLPPYKAGITVPDGFRAMRAHYAENPENQTLGERCLMSFGNSSGPVMLPLLYNNNYEIVQSRDTVAIVVEMVHDVRMIHLGAKHRTDGIRPWMGDSVGWYEGPTLVVETTNFPQATAMRGAWKELKVTERFTRVGSHRIRYQFTAEDPTVWDAAWGGEYEFGPAKGRIFEYACHEGNYALEGILAGARAEEAAAAQNSAAAQNTAAVPPVKQP